jgi:hypothetical protein
MSELTEQQAMEFVQSGIQRHIDRLINRWHDPYSPTVGRALQFTESGLARLYATLGWIGGMQANDNDHASKLALYFITTLDRLARYGGTEDVKGEVIPKCIVEAADDRCFGSFSLLWYRYQGFVEKPNSLPVKDNRRVTDGEHTMVWQCKSLIGYEHVYKYSMNGGLIFHGDTNSNPWMIHT